MSFLLGNWKLVAYVVLAVGIAWAGAVVKGKFDRARDADRLEQQQKEMILAVTAERKLRRESDDARILLSAQIEEYQRRIEVDVRTVIKRVPILVKDSRVCDLQPDAIKAINTARGQP